MSNELRIRVAAAGMAALLASAAAVADDLTMKVETGLAGLGYDTGPVDGVESMETVIAISKFQAERGMPVTGEVTPQLVGVIEAAASGAVVQTAQPSSAPAAAPPARDPQALRAAQDKCLQEKMAAAQKAQQTKRGFGKLLSGISRAAGQFGGSGLAGDIAQTTGDIYAADATATDFAQAAKDLGLTESEVEECRNPG